MKVDLVKTRFSVAYIHKNHKCIELRKSLRKGLFPYKVVMIDQSLLCARAHNIVLNADSQIV